MKKQIAKFDIKEILPIALVLVVAGIGIAYGLNVQADVRSDFTANTLEYNATTDSMEGVSTLAEKMPLIATIIVAAIVIGILVRYLFVRFG